LAVVVLLLLVVFAGFVLAVVFARSLFLAVPVADDEHVELPKGFAAAAAVAAAVSVDVVPAAEVMVDDNN